MSHKNSHHFIRNLLIWTAHKLFLKVFKRVYSDNEIEGDRAWGGGRAERGVFGALIDAEHLLHQIGKESVVEEFRYKTESIKRSDTKEKKVFLCRICSVCR